MLPQNVHFWASASANGC